MYYVTDDDPGGVFRRPAKTPLQLEIERARFLLEKAFDEDGEEQKEEAIELYMEAAELCLNLVWSIFTIF